MVGHHHRFAGERSSKLLREPALGDVIPGSQVVRSQPSVAQIGPDALEIIHALPGSIASRERIPCGGEVSPSSGAKNSHVTERQGFVLQHVDMAGRGVLHLPQSAIKVPIVKFVIPCDVGDLAVKGLVGPLNAPGLLVDVASEDNKVDRGIERGQVAGAKLEMEV